MVGEVYPALFEAGVTETKVLGGRGRERRSRLYLIDGNNLIGRTKRLSLKRSNCRQQLIDHLIPFCNKRNKQALVFFDASWEPLRKGQRIEVKFSGPNRTADDPIRRAVEHSTAPKNDCVVSSDNEVYGYTRVCGSQALRCHEFNRLLNEIGHTNANSGKPKDVDDMDYWSKRFLEQKE